MGMVVGGLRAPSFSRMNSWFLFLLLFLFLFSFSRNRSATKRECPLRQRLAGKPRTVSRGPQPLLIFPSLWGKCLRQTGQNFLISNFSAIVRLFFVVT
jgi:hypothetical protein